MCFCVEGTNFVSSKDSTSGKCESATTIWKWNVQKERRGLMVCHLHRPHSHVEWGLFYSLCIWISNEIISWMAHLVIHLIHVQSRVARFNLACASVGRGSHRKKGHISTLFCQMINTYISQYRSVGQISTETISLWFVVTLLGVEKVGPSPSDLLPKKWRIWLTIIPSLFIREKRNIFPPRTFRPVNWISEKVEADVQMD